VVRDQEKEVTLSLRDRLLGRVLSLLGGGYLHLVGWTSRFRVTHHPAAAALINEGRPCVFAFWHRYQLIMAYEHRHKGVHVLVSRSKDGELIAQALERLGYRTARGSSTRGGASALRELLEAVASGGQAAVTPDGPKGPFRAVHPGVAALSSKTGAPIVPIGWAGTKVKAVPSWDRFLIPLPFGRYEVRFGEPFVAPSDGAAAQESIRAALDGAAAEADRRLGEPLS
jgi:lysophospholipid acyltransferase (LPLAT)-like uncharacterized protein